VSLPHGPDSLTSALERWERQLRAADAGAREAPADRILTFRIEDLTTDARERTYRSLLDFLGLQDSEGIREHFENRLLPAGANPGRWELDLSASQRQELGRAYERALSAMESDGVAAAPVLRESMAREEGPAPQQARGASSL
jgi:hypothetical protein